VDLIPDGWPLEWTPDVHPRIADAWLAADAEAVEELEKAVSADLVFEAMPEPTLRVVSSTCADSGITGDP
jgi:hypothetical protein